MSRQIGYDTLRLRPTPRIAHTEFSMEFHPEYLKTLGGNLYDVWEYDLGWCTHDGPIDWAKTGRTTFMGHAAFRADGSDQKAADQCPFTDVREVYEFDPIREYGIPDQAELTRFYEEWHQSKLADSPGQVVGGGYYKTLISGALETFGWDMLLEAAADQARFAKVLERFADYTLHHTRAYADTSIEHFIQHDDMVWSEGPFMTPEFYHKVIFPLYEKMWKPLKQAGKLIIYISDGRYDMFMPALAACGAQGFMFEPVNDLDRIVAQFGKTHCLVGSKVDCRTMSFGTWEQVKVEMDATLALAKQCPGFIWAVGNHIPANVPDEICARYIEYLKANWRR